MLEGSRPSGEDLQTDIAGVPSLPSRYYLLKRPDQALTLAYTPTVQEYRVTEEKIESYVAERTANYLTPDEIDRLLAKPVTIEEAESDPLPATAKPSGTSGQGGEVPPDDFYH
jgi:hypothetical protein